MGYEKFENESDNEVIYRICNEKDKIGTWEDVKEILNKLLGVNYTESAYRKKFQSFQNMLDDNQSKFASDDTYLREINESKRELQKERYKLSTEKTEYNKWLRENARDELIIEKIRDAISNIKPLTTPTPIIANKTDKGYCLCFGDSHYGCEFSLYDIMGNVLNSYSPEIFEERMWNLLNKTVDIILKENIKYLTVLSLGDELDGMLRVSQLMKLRYGVVDSTIKYSYFISEWLNELSKYVKIDFCMVGGNHTELRMLGQPKSSFKNDNMSKIIAEFIKILLKGNPNFNFVENPTGLIYTSIAGNTIFATHGEEKDCVKALNEYSRIYNVDINYFISAHKHHSEEIGKNCEIVSVPSIIGCDDYSLSLRRMSNAGAELLVFDNVDGLVCKYKIKLN